MEDIKISIIVPAYNVASYIGRCMESILNSTHRNIEVIAINDGSLDETGEILEAYAERDSRLIVIHQKNAGLIMVREKGISMATGDYIGFVDGDDAVEPDMYERLLKNALEFNADISHCGLCVYWDANTKEMHYGTGNKMVQTSEEALCSLLQSTSFDPSLCNKLYKKSLMADSCLDLTIQSNEDMLRNFVLFSRAKTIVYEDFCGYQYWSRRGSMSNDSKIIQRIQQTAKVRKIILDKASEKVYPYAMRLWLSTYVGTINQNYKNKDIEIRELCKECRLLLKKEKRNISYLIRRQQVAAYMIIYMPCLYRLVYGIYSNRRKSMCIN